MYCILISITRASYFGSLTFSHSCGRRKKGIDKSYLKVKMKVTRVTIYLSLSYWPAAIGIDQGISRA